MNKQILRLADPISRRSFIGGSDARIIMGIDEAALIRRRREKCGEAEPEGLSAELGKATKDFNRVWYSGRRARDRGDAAIVGFIARPVALPLEHHLQRAHRHDAGLDGALDCAFMRLDVISPHASVGTCTSYPPRSLRPRGSRHRLASRGRR